MRVSLTAIVSGVRASRLLSILLLLQTRGRLTAQQLAGELEVSVRTIHRDVESLHGAGIPLYGDAGRLTRTARALGALYPVPPAGLLLAAGAGRRYGMPKALVERDGRLLVERGVATLRAGGCDPVVVVLGAAADTVRDRADFGDVVIVINDAWADGMGSSLRAGLAVLDGTGAPAVAVLLVDTPGITADAVRRVAAGAGPDVLRVATYHGKQGHPVLLGRAHWAGVAQLADGDVGARPYLAAHRAEVTRVACEDVADGADVDRPPDAGA
jgi:nicotine blue oxidoreductase